jgi:hypothetical protein
MAYSFTTAVNGLAKLEVYRKKEDFPKGITSKVDAFIQLVIKSFPYWANEDKATFKTMVAVIDDTHPALFPRLRNDLKVLVGVVTLKDVAKTTKNPDIIAELVKLSKGIESLRAELAKVFAEMAKEIETPKPKKKAKGSCAGEGVNPNTLRGCCDFEEEVLPL